MSSRVMFRSVPVILCLALAVTAVPDVVLSSPANAAAASAAKSQTVGSRPDRVSAMSTAQLQGSPVEDLSQATPTSATFANPDGTWTTKAYAGIVRSQNDADKWVPIDPSVKKDGGSYVPAAAPFDATYSDGGDKTVGSVDTSTKSSVSVGWPTSLPTPTADGSTLTYPDAAPDTNLVVSSHADGFDYSMVLDHAPADGAAPIEFKVPLNLDHLDSTVSADGAIVFKDGKSAVASMTAPIMWDGAKVNANGSGTTVPVAANVQGTGDSQTLVLTPDMKFLQDPSTVYPVTVDPSLVINTAGDTWVQSAGDTTSQYTSPQLNVGSNEAGQPLHGPTFTSTSPASQQSLAQ